MENHKQFIDGKWVDAHKGGILEVVNPATEKVFATVPRSGQKDADQALEAATKAQKGWARLTGVQRGEILLRVADLIEGAAYEIAETITLEQGKPLAHAKGEVAGGVTHLRYHAQWARRLEGTVLAPDCSDNHALIMKFPYGVVVCLIPWNFPFTVMLRKIAPALMAGNAVVAKPHEDTPLSALKIASLFEQAGLPAGVLNIVTGTGTEAGACLTNHPATQVITLTGSVRAGKQVMANAANNLAVVSLELGGKAPFIVMDDCDLDKAASDATLARFRNCGQVCTSNERTYVHESVYEQFLEKLLANVAKLRLGNPLGDVDIGPKVNRAELEKIEQMVAKALSQGARIAAGGHRPDGAEFDKGFWYMPTVLVNVSQDMDIMQQEIFGPVLPIMPVRDFEDALEKANDSQFGLTGYLYTNNYNHIMRAMTELDLGEMYVNRIGPEAVHGYHTGYRNSGIGGDDGKYGFETYLKKKTIYLKYD